MNYSALTIDDPNPIKRYLQRSRFNEAIALYPQSSDVRKVLDFGGGNGELCLRLANHDLKSSFICYEPAVGMYNEAKGKIAFKDRVSLINSLELISPGSIDIIYSLEVFEHLPEKESNTAIECIFSILKPGGTLIIGVPNELFVAAIYKGAFRMFRRFGEFDARLINVLKCLTGRPPLNRPEGEISPGKQYYFHHLGFDHRALRECLKDKFANIHRVCSPFSFIGEWGSPEIYYILNKG